MITTGKINFRLAFLVAALLLGSEQINGLVLKRCPITCVYDNKSLLSKGASASQSSTYEHGDADNAIDGQPEKDLWGDHSSSHTEEDNGPWWEVKLDKPYYIARVDIKNRVEDGCGRRLQDFQLEIFSDDQLVASGTGDGIKEWYRLNFPNKYGNVVRISLPGITQFLSLVEVEVYGTEDNLSQAYAEVCWKDEDPDDTTPGDCE